MYFDNLVLEPDEQQFSLTGVKSKKISSHPGRGLLKSVLKVKMLESKLSRWKEKTN